MAQAGLGYKFRFACWHTVCGRSSEHRSISKLEHSVATRRKWVLMSFPAFIFCTVRHPYGSTKMSATPAGANILQPPWWHCRQSFTCSQVIACSRHSVYLWIRCVRVCVCKRRRACFVYKESVTDAPYGFLSGQLLTHELYLNIVHHSRWCMSF